MTTVSNGRGSAGAAARRAAPTSWLLLAAAASMASLSQAICSGLSLLKADMLAAGRPSWAAS
jgi:hypothetical protein